MNGRLVTRYSNCFIIILFILFLSGFVPFASKFERFQMDSRIPFYNQRNFYVNCVQFLIIAMYAKLLKRFQFIFHFLTSKT